MTRFGERPYTRRGDVRVCAVLGWLFAVLAVVSCCSLAETGAAAHHATTATMTATPAPVTAPPSTARIVVVAEAPGGRGAGSSCHGASEHATPVVLSPQAAPVALPTSTVAAPEGRLTGAAGIRGPSNDAAGAVDRLRLQVQRT
ncbi:hypothetical protein [Streptomyces sp. NBC_01637]|uniref:hypothetical protein n=1 Tax=unclassified Streptomyces TaxID=2593676 RepID=UPI00386F3F2B|nr:hypothetical protein OH719_11425 [Streptomyces sp. NBC_01653]WTD92445.1 hypothetical protein OG891_35445 [Streptomyces sp. NBC_01637]